MAYTTNAPPRVDPRLARAAEFKRAAWKNAIALIGGILLVCCGLGLIVTASVGWASQRGKAGVVITVFGLVFWIGGAVIGVIFRVAAESLEAQVAAETTP